MKPSEMATRAGLRFGDKGTHTSRTIMLAELVDLLAAVPNSAGREDYAAAIIADNVLGKATVATRRSTNQRLGELYGLDPRLPIFRVLRRLWAVDGAGRPLLALLCALARDPLLRITAPSVLTLTQGQELVRSTFAEAVRTSVGNRLNDAILGKVLRNAGSSWTQSGHLEGRVRKIRRRVEATPGALAFAVWLGSLFSMTGEELLATPWTSVLDRLPGELYDLVLRAKQLRLLQAHIGGDVVEIDPTGLDRVLEVRG
jgi:hypothetical protein